MVDYVKEKFNFFRRQNSYRASKLTIKKYFSGIKAGISQSLPVKTSVLPIVTPLVQLHLFQIAQRIVLEIRPRPVELTFSWLD